MCVGKLIVDIRPRPNQKSNYKLTISCMCTYLFHVLCLRSEVTEKACKTALNCHVLLSVKTIWQHGDNFVPDFTPIFWQFNPEWSYIHNRSKISKLKWNHDQIYGSKFEAAMLKKVFAMNNIKTFWHQYLQREAKVHSHKIFFQN